MQPNLFAVLQKNKKKKRKKKEEEEGCVPHQELGFGYLLPCLYSLILSLIAARSGGNIGGLGVRYCMLASFWRWLEGLCWKAVGETEIETEGDD